MLADGCASTPERYLAEAFPLQFLAHFLALRGDKSLLAVKTTICQSPSQCTLGWK
jgi:hypothetical protein